MKKKIIFSLLFGMAFFTAQAQDSDSLFAVQVGVFRQPKIQYFSSLQDLGEIHTQVIQAYFTRIFVGKLPTRAQADSLLVLVQKRGFSDAFSRPFWYKTANDSSKTQTNDSTKTLPEMRFTAFAVQIGAFKDKTNLPNFSNLDSIGTVYEVEGELVKFRLGDFNNRDTAEFYLKKVQNLGYPQAFVVRVDMPAAKRFFQTMSHYKRMEGTMNDKSVVVHLYITEASLSGFYNDPKDHKRKTFIYYGFKDKNFAPSKSSRTAAFDPEYKLNLTVKDRETGEDLKFSLSEKYPQGSVRFEIISLFRKKMASGSRGEMGTDLYVEFPLMKNSLNKLLEDEFNRLAAQLPEIKDAKDKKALHDRLEKVLISDIEELKKHYPNYKWLSETYETKILENTKYLLSAKFSKEHIIAEPKSQTLYRSFDLKTGKQLSLSSVLNTQHRSVLSKIIEKQLLEQFYRRNQTDEIKQSIEEMLENYYFTTSGIVFSRDFRNHFSYKEPIEMTIPYSQIGQLIRKESFLGGF